MHWHSEDACLSNLDHVCMPSERHLCGDWSASMSPRGFGLRPSLLVRSWNCVWSKIVPGSGDNCPNLSRKALVNGHCVGAITGGRFIEGLLLVALSVLHLAVRCIYCSGISRLLRPRNKDGAPFGQKPLLIIRAPTHRMLWPYFWA